VSIYIFFDLEATSANPEEAEILQIAAAAKNREPFNAFLSVESLPTEDDEFWELVGFSHNTYINNARDAKVVLQEFLNYVGSEALAGHNILGFDLPVINRQLKMHELKRLDNRALDTLRLAHLILPTPPHNLIGYGLSDLYQFFSRQKPASAHEALADVRTNIEVAKYLKDAAGKVDPNVTTVWSALEIEEAEFLGLQTPKKPEQLIEALQKTLGRDANIPWVHSEGKPFPATWSNPDEHANLLGDKREAQLEMMKLVFETLGEKGHALLIEAPTGTGKTRGYLFPILHKASKEKPQSKPYIVATHTKVLQTQAIEELQKIADEGYAVSAVNLKSPRDYLCLDALKEAFNEREHLSEDGRAVTGALIYYASIGGYDLESLPAYWRSRPGFREVLYRVETNAKRCGQGLEHRHCAFTRVTSRKKRAKVWVTNQAWLLAHQAAFTQSEEDACCSLVVDEAHNLEGQATASFARQVSGEELSARIRRLYDPKRGIGLFRDRGRLTKLLGSEPSEPLLQFSKKLREDYAPKLLAALKELDKGLIFLAKNYGHGDPRYDIRLDLMPVANSKKEWPQIAGTVGSVRNQVIQLLNKLREVIPEDSRLYYRLDPLFDALDRFLELTRLMQQAVGGRLDEKEWVAELVYASDAWTILAQPVDLVEHLAPLWRKTRGAVFTSATLDLGDDFAYIKRALGVEETFKKVAAKKLPGVLPYNKAHLIVPGHLPEARGDLQKRFSRLLHEELKQILPYAKRSLNLFTSTARLKEAGSKLKKSKELSSDILLPLTRKEREDAVQRMRAQPEAPGHTFGSRSFMEGVDLPNLKLVGLERIPFPVPNRLLEARGQLAELQGLNLWEDVYMPKATLFFVQAFGRLIRDSRVGAGEGVFVLWDKRIVNAFYQTRFLDALPKGVNKHFPKTREEFYNALAPILDVERKELPSEELLDGALRRLYEIRESETGPLEKAVEIARVFWEGIDLAKEAEREKKQREAMSAAFSGQNVFVFLPTGYGKSLVFQLPAFVEEGLTIVVSPLKALMADQVSGLQDRGLPAAKVDSSMFAAARGAVYEEVRKGNINLLYLSPERIVRDLNLRSLIKEKIISKHLKRFVFDEAHSVSEWGHDFRPDYLDAVKLIRSELAPGVPITALTATAIPRVRSELYEIFGLSDEDVEVIEAHPDRPEIKYYVHKARGEAAPIQKLSELTQLLSHLSNQYEEGAWSVIAYVLTKRQSERLAWALGRLGFKAEAYHAGLGDLVRAEVQSRFEEGETPIVVATKAFGMGIDKSNVRAVVHFEPPESLEAYLQGSGRAGRDGKEAYALLSHSPSDWKLLEWMATRWSYDENHVTALLEILASDEDWLGYAEDLVKEINALANEGGDEDGYGDIGENDLKLILSRAASLDVLTYEHFPGKAAMLADDCGIVEVECPGIAKVEGDRCLLDFASLKDFIEAARKYDWLYDKWRSGYLRVFRSYQPALRIQLINRRSSIRLRNQTRKQHKLAEERVRQVRKYAEHPGCFRKYLLHYQDAELGQCSGCGYHDGDPPWWAVEKLNINIIRDAYRPKEVILDFLQWMQDAFEAWQEQRGEEKRFNGYGSAVIANALIGKQKFWSGSEQRTVPKWLMNNRFFGRLAFVTWKEIKKQLEELAKAGLIDAESYLSGYVYRINETGRRELSRLTRRAARE